MGRKQAVPELGEWAVCWKTLSFEIFEGVA